MLNVSKNRTEDSLEVRLSGSIDESTRLDQLIGATPRELRLYCKDVSSINSMGVVRWIRYLLNARNQGCLVRLYECSTALVDQMNNIQNFSCGARIESVCVPFVCRSCKIELIAVFGYEDLRKIEPSRIQVKCPHCTNNVVLDDDPLEYFRFLSHSS